MFQSGNIIMFRIRSGNIILIVTQWCIYLYYRKINFKTVKLLKLGVSYSGYNMAHAEPDASRAFESPALWCCKRHLVSCDNIWIHSKLTRACLYMDMIQLKLYSHSSNGSTERLETLFWMSRSCLGLGIIHLIYPPGICTCIKIFKRMANNAHVSMKLQRSI